jgi:hypothetical protein
MGRVLYASCSGLNAASDTAQGCCHSVCARGVVCSLLAYACNAVCCNAVVAACRCSAQLMLSQKSPANALLDRIFCVKSCSTGSL